MKKKKHLKETVHGLCGWYIKCNTIFRNLYHQLPKNSKIVHCLFVKINNMVLIHKYQLLVKWFSLLPGFAFNTRLYARKVLFWYDFSRLETTVYIRF